VKKFTHWLRVLPLLIGLALAGLLVFFNFGGWADDSAMYATPSTFQAAASPGDLSLSHAFLDNNCAACHTPVQGVKANSCIACHANEESLLQRQPTAFHAEISSCIECHREHQGRDSRPVTMDHASLAKIGLRELDGNPDPQSEDQLALRQLHDQLGKGSTDIALLNPHLSASEMILDCAACHQNDDRHFELFGNDCASCHATTAWTLPEFRHPSSASMDCAQCHQAPPSHYMGHFNMISQKVAGQPHATVEQCYKCHQTTSWPDIKGVGWYKHH
jgi:hypothetical protein